jgi:LuxR family transcriptional regulator, quorum-sensing system regulator VjbR
MHFNLAHFPDFQEGFFSGTVDHEILEMLIEIRQQLGCLHLTHLGYADQTVTKAGPIPDIAVLTTLPTTWALRYSAKNYYKVDPLMRTITLSGEISPIRGTVRDLGQDALAGGDSATFQRDRERRGLGNLFLGVNSSNSYGFRGLTEFTFQVEPAEQRLFTERIRKRLVAIASRIHTALHGSRNPALAAAAAKLLTKREIDCLYWAANGKTDGEIGEILDIARWTVVTYLQNAKNKLGCANRTAAVVTALALGVIEMPVISHRF